jgi:AraC-like DNA-binding protein
MRTLAAARLELAKAYAMANSSRQNLSVEDLAAQLGISSRTVQKLFEREGATFSSFLLEHRLNRAYHILTDPTQNRIGAVAYRVGFGDLSYFNHCFKRRYGATPREIRKDAARRMQKEH